ncbi:TRAP transporter substrate-binding protein DctP [Paracoccus pantotrophus]|uniref:TRAP transporter substrate-binding protein DctP n=1 Tax=Paracoccus pantotrophus TaxID=82367 RepID=UPI0018CC094A|nr:TRAP transporter substrate-binding protein DctP [Paracoccus pantotrophus]
MRLKDVVTAAAFTAAFVPMASARDLVYSSFAPANHEFNARVLPPAFDLVKEKTGQAVSVTVGGALAGSRDSLSSLSSGAIDGALLVYLYNPTELPTLNFVSSLAASDNRIAGPANTEVVLQHCPQCLEELKGAGIVSLHDVATEPQVLMCKTPVEKTADLKGKKVRAILGIANMLAELGATPVNLAASEVYEALQRGQIDCAVQPVATLQSFSLWDVAKYVTDLPMDVPRGISPLSLNLNTWDAFSDEEKAAWWKAGAESLARTERIFSAKPAEIRELAKAEHGVTYVEPSEELVTAYHNVQQNQTASLIAQAEGRGVRNPQELADAFTASLKKWSAIVEEIGTDPNWTDEQWNAYGEAIDREIYSKLQ